MAKNNNLKDFLIDIANAIRAKKGTTETIKPQDFSSEIESIKSGGGVVSIPMRDVNFYDYDGILLHSYTKEQFLALSAMPELPTREGLICQGWNWDLSEAKSYVRDYGKQNIGAMYITDDGDTRLYIHIEYEHRMVVPLRWNQTLANGVSIDWGDGSAIQTFTGTGNKNTTHTYATPGDYVIRLKVSSGCTMGLGGGSTSYCIMGASGNSGRIYCNMLQKAEIGSGVTAIGAAAFYNCHSLASVSIPSSITSTSTYIFYNCYSLTSVTLPNGIASLQGYAFANCTSLRSVAIPSSVTSVGSSVFYVCYSLISIAIPNNVKTIDSSAFYNCYSLAVITLPDTITKINSSAFYNCVSLVSINLSENITSIGSNAIQLCLSLVSIVIPSGVTDINTSTFSSCYGMAIYDFTSHTSVPTLANTNAFTNIPSDCVIKVPASLLEEWKSATNWSTYASKIVGV